MMRLDIEALTLYAYSNQAHARDRELWRGFLCYILPPYFGLQEDEFESLLNESVVFTLDELHVREEHLENHETRRYEVIRAISALLAQELNLQIEFGLAAFYEGVLPSQLYKTYEFHRNPTKKKHHENLLVAQWLDSFKTLRSESHFLEKLEFWKTWLLHHDDMNVAVYDDIEIVINKTTSQKLA